MKREQRAARAAFLLPSQTNGKASDAMDAAFRKRADALRSLFAGLDPVDVIVSLGVSELWLPNRSSQVKHVFALQIALGMQAEDFTATKQIDSFEAFRAFCSELLDLLPSNPMLEDFVPEADWGDILCSTDGRIGPVFFGCSVERIPDFVEAFRIVRADDPQALADMRLALAVQAHVIESVPASHAGSAEHVDAGHIEIPTPDFWAACREALLSTSAAVQVLAQGTSKALTIQLGALRPPITWEEFGDGVMTGAALPNLTVQIGQSRVPISPRSASTVVVDLWTARPVGADVNLTHRADPILTRGWMPTA